MGYVYRCGSDEKRRGFYILRDNVQGGKVHITDMWIGDCWWSEKDRSQGLPKLYPSIDEYTTALRQCEAKGAPE